MFHWLMKRAGVRLLLLALGLIILPLAGWLIWIGSSPLMRVLAHRLPDLRWQQTAGYLFETIVMYEQHRANIGMMYGLDFILAVGMFLLFASLLGWCLRPQGPGQGSPAWVLVIPFMTMICDWWENSLVLMFTGIYPTPLILQLFPLFQGVLLAKFTFLGLSLLTVLAGAGVWLWRKGFGKNNLT